MSDWVNVATNDELAPGTRKIVDVDDTRVLVANVDGKYYAVESVCTHAMFDLDEAEIENHEVICPLHGARFCIKTGAVTAPPAFEGLPVFSVRVENDMVQVRDTRWD